MAVPHDPGGAMLTAEGVLGDLGQGLEWLALGIDLIGVLIVVFGFGVSLISLVRCLAKGVGLMKDMSDLQHVRLQLGRYILVGIEFMIASDIIHTVVTRELMDLAFVAAMVAIRTAISFFLGKELAEAGRPDR